jgi:hypothetical protein
MNDINILDLDKFETADRFVSLRGEKYKVLSFDVKQFIQYCKDAKELEKKSKEAGEESMIEVTQESIDLVKKMIPTITDEVIGSLNLTQLGLIIKFIIETGNEGKPVAAENDSKKN